MTQATPTTGPLGEVTCLEGDTFCVSGSSGQIRAGGEQGLFIRDLRVLNVLLLRVGGAEPQPLHGRTVAANAARFTAYCQTPVDGSPDPRLLVDHRRVVSTSLWEEIRLTNYGGDTLTLAVGLSVGSDFAYIFDVKHGRTRPQAPAVRDDGGLRLTGGGGHDALVHTSPLPDEVHTRAAELRWRVRLPARGSWAVTVRVGMTDADGVLWPRRTWSTAAATQPAVELPWEQPEVRCSDQRFASLVAQSVADLASLLLEDPERPEDRFLAAGSPWFLTMFGRDSLWGAFMALPLGVELAGQTLRSLARRQGRRRDPETEEAPGKILHEVRHGGLAHHSDLPPLYFGSMDATPLFVIVLHEAWRWGLDGDRVAELLPAAERALRWLREDGDADGDGFLEYRRSGSRGLANQGWKDSEDAIQFADGRLAAPPIALCEVQAYAYEAAVRGAELLDRFGGSGAQDLRQWAKELRARFRAAFWVGDGDAAYPAIALDGSGRRVDGIASNMGHLPASGMLDDDEIARVAGRLALADMDSGWGIRTLSAASPRFNPLAYHGGSVWPHDTAIAVHHLAATGHAELAGRLLRGLVAAAPYYDYRLPELFGGEQRHPGGFPLPYPAACRPQAWAAGAALLMLRSVLGVEPHVPERRLTLRPMWPAPYRQLHVAGLRLAGQPLTLTVVRDRGLFVHTAPPGLRIDVVGAPRLTEPPELIEPPPPGS